MKIEVKGLVKRYGDALAVKNIDLTVNPGEFVVLLGPSGCGKTTTLRSIAGLEDPTDGEITIGETTVFSRRKGISVNPEGRNVGMVFQSYALWPHMTVFENVAFPLRSRRRSSQAEVAKRVSSALELVGLEAYAGRSVSLLSGGQMQRVALARALVAEPAALLLDEPLSNLDLRLRHMLRAELKRIQTTIGATSVYVTHDQTEAASLADRVVVMHEGRIAQETTPEDLFDNPNSALVARFLGIPNVMTFRPIERDDLGRYRGLLEGAVRTQVQTSATLPLGQNLDCWFRGDALELTNEEGPAAMPGKVVVRAFTGTEYQYHIELAGDDRDVAVVVHLPLAHKLDVGDHVRLRFRPEKLRMFPTSERNAAAA